MVFSEIAPARVLKIKNANYLVLIYKRNAKLRARFRVGFDITRVAGDIRGKHRLFALRRGTHQATTDGNVMLDVNIFFKTDRKTVYQLLLGGIQQQDGEHVVIDDL